MLHGVCCTVKREWSSAHDLKGDEKHSQIVQNLWLCKAELDKWQDPIMNDGEDGNYYNMCKTKNGGKNHS